MVSGCDRIAAIDRIFPKLSVPKQRLDVLLVELNLCETRQQAQGLIRAGEVRVNQQLIDKPGTDVDTAAVIEVRQRSPYVSRGGEKLAKAIAEFEFQWVIECAWMGAFPRAASPIVCCSQARLTSTA
jgi:hypothetical protein